jgi:hypothetical protein
MYKLMLLKHYILFLYRNYINIINNLNYLI